MISYTGLKNLKLNLNLKVKNLNPLLTQWLYFRKSGKVNKNVVKETFTIKQKISRIH